jgi:heptose I phosphotransferase
VTSSPRHDTFRVHPRFRDVLERHGLTDCEALVDSQAGVLLRKLPTRENWRLELDDADGRIMRLYLKKHVVRTPGTCWHAWCGTSPRLTAARFEADCTETLSERGVPTMTVAAYGESLRSNGTLVAAFLTEELAGFEQLDLFLLRRFRDRRDPALRRLIAAVANVARRFHSLGCNHRDFYTCHFMIRETPSDRDAPETPPFAVHLIDLQRVQFRSSWLRGRWIVKDLAQLAYSCPPHLVGPAERMRFFKAWLGGTRLDRRSRRLARRVLKKEAAMRRKHGPYRDWNAEVHSVWDRAPGAAFATGAAGREGRAA